MFSAQVDEGLELRLLEPRHAETLFKLVDQNREHLGYWFPWVEDATVENPRKFIASGLEQLAKDNGFQTGIWVDGELVGVVGLHYISQQFRSTEIGYWLGEGYQGRGIMTKVCRYLCAYLFEELNLNRVEIRCSATNTRSRAIPERLGFRLEGTLRQMGYTEDGWVDFLIYGLLVDDRF